MDLSTKYMGFDLPHPLIPGAAPLATHLDPLKQLKDAGAAAIVLPDLVEIGGEIVDLQGRSILPLLIELKWTDVHPAPSPCLQAACKEPAAPDEGEVGPSEPHLRIRAHHAPEGNASTSTDLVPARAGDRRVAHADG